MPAPQLPTLNIREFAMYLIEQHWVSTPTKPRYVKVWRRDEKGRDHYTPAMFRSWHDATVALDIFYACNSNSAFNGAEVVDES